MQDLFYELSAKDIKGQEVQMKTFSGKTLLIVNTASECGFTPQLGGLEKLYKKYKEEGLVILGFPCNQFGKQEPGDEKSIEEGCMVNYGVSFPMFAKVDVNGDATHPVFKFLKAKLGGILGSRIKWNFTKFIVDNNGKPIKRFSPVTKPEKIDGYLEKFFNKN